MNFKKWIKEKRNIEHIGKLAIFYVPEKKINKKIRKLIHNFFISKFNAYTHETSNIKGYWSSKNKLYKDKHERYEISFKGSENYKILIEFIERLCKIIKEDSIYLTIDNDSFLIKPN